MGQIPAVGSSGEQAFGAHNSLNDVDIDDFLKLMIAELQNQDPLNPLENDELVAQIGQIRSVGATEKLSETLDSVLLGQNISSATNLIGAEIDAISDDNQKVTGTVERVSVANGQPKLHLDLDPRAAVSTEAGDIAAGEYEYRVTWQFDGKLYGVDPLAKQDGSLTVKGDDKSILLGNLPVTLSQKQVFRREKGETNFHLVGSITDGKKSTFLDTTATEDLSDYIMTGEPTMQSPSRTFVVSVKNVGVIRPPERPTATPAPSTPPVTSPPPVDDPNAPGEETLENTDSGIDA
jgi:flagellar basal-body rod modification protein FlgD